MAAMEQETQTTQGQFTSLGTTVLDDIYVEDRLVASNSLGGGAIWAAIGARIFADTTQQVSLRIVAGYDFPSEVEGSLRHYGISFRLTRQRNAPSTRAELRYLDASLETRAFRYLNNVLQPKPADLSGTPMLWSRALHLLSAPQEVAGTISELMAVRSYRGMRPLFIWEPRPATCVPENLTYLIEAVKHVDVFSPNHIELLAFFDEPASTLFYKTQIENYAWKFVDSGVGPYCDGIVLIRCAEHGVLLISRTMEPTWVPAFWSPDPSGPNIALNEDALSSTSTLVVSDFTSPVVDTTGAGNAFLGGFTMGLLQTGDPIRAANYGAVSSSFVVQQLGLPTLTAFPSSADNDGQGVLIEQWNGDIAWRRLAIQYQQAGVGDQNSPFLTEGAEPGEGTWLGRWKAWAGSCPGETRSRRA